MNKKVFYGEYTLIHWVELILKKDIVLPAYQRCFVWDEEQVKRFIKSLKDGNFVPPVIIGTYNGQNIILDGQQRLSAILLGYLGKLPKKDVFRITDDPTYVDDNEGIVAATPAVDAAATTATATPVEEAEPEAIEWTFKLLLKDDGKNSKSDLLGRATPEKYNNLPADEILDDAFMNSSYLGFSYIVPATTETTVTQMKFYSTVFHDINMQGVELKAQESRRSLYYLDNDLVPFFEPIGSERLKVIQNGKTVRYDFVRALAFTSQYAKQNSEASIALKCKKQAAFEKYYADYIDSVISDEDSTVYGKFSTQVGKSNIGGRATRLQQYVTDLGYNNVFPSIIDADAYLIGLKYHVMMKGEELDTTRFENLKNDIAAKVATYKASENHRHTPNGVYYLRQRVRESIQTYQGYVA